MKLISWNVNGLRAALKKGFMDYFLKEDADIFCLNEIKLSHGQLDLDLPGYRMYWNYAEKKGYSGVAVFTKIPPINVTYGIGVRRHDNEGRVITCEFSDFFLVACYTPNAKRKLERLEDRMDWEDEFRRYLLELDKRKPVILCGDLNVAHREIDLANPKTNRRNAGFTDEERGKLSELLEAGFIDTFRYFYPDREEAYSWWSYFAKSRERNIGWRIDYFIVSQRLAPRLEDAEIHGEVHGSDHCPVVLTLKDE